MSHEALKEAEIEIARLRGLVDKLTAELNAYREFRDRVIQIRQGISDDDRDLPSCSSCD